MNAALKQHLIDPEVCIRCNTCEETCPVDAITHDANNYVVDASKCNFCMDCISPCPTGSIDSWRIVGGSYSLDDQFSWEELPPQDDISASATADGSTSEALDGDIAALIALAHGGVGGKSIAPASAAKPVINLHNRERPLMATITGNFRLTDSAADNDVRHIILDFGDAHFPVLEGQSIGIAPPGVDASGQPHRARLYSISSPRHGEKPNTNNLALTVKREPDGLCSQYLCNLKKGDQVAVTGPFGATFLMPNDPAADILMICTGTGSAPFRGFTEWRRRMMPQASGRLMLFFGARRPEELPYFGPLQKVPEHLLTKRFAYSRVPAQPKIYVQDMIRQDSAMIGAFLARPTAHIYLCGLRGMEQGVEAALDDVSRAHGLVWPDLRQTMRADGRYHVETY